MTPLLTAHCHHRYTQLQLSKPKDSAARRNKTFSSFYMKISIVTFPLNRNNEPSEFYAVRMCESVSTDAKGEQKASISVKNWNGNNNWVLLKRCYPPCYPPKCNFSKFPFFSFISKYQLFPKQKNNGKPLFPLTPRISWKSRSITSKLWHTQSLFLDLGQLVSDTPVKSRLQCPNPGDPRGAEQSMSVTILTAVSSSAPHFNSVLPEHKLKNTPGRKKKKKAPKTPHWIHRVYQKC